MYHYFILFCFSFNLQYRGYNVFVMTKATCNYRNEDKLPRAKEGSALQMDMILTRYFSSTPPI